MYAHFQHTCRVRTHTHAHARAQACMQHADPSRCLQGSTQTRFPAPLHSGLLLGGFLHSTAKGLGALAAMFGLWQRERLANRRWSWGLDWRLGDTRWSHLLPRAPRQFGWSACLQEYLSLLPAVPTSQHLAYRRGSLPGVVSRLTLTHVHHHPALSLHHLQPRPEPQSPARPPGPLGHLWLAPPFCP